MSDYSKFVDSSPCVSTILPNFLSAVKDQTVTDVEIAGIKNKNSRNRLTYKNLAALLKESGSSTDNVIKTTVFIKDMNDFAKVNEIYASYFTKDCPARSCVEVARLPKDVLIEIEAIAYK